MKTLREVKVIERLPSKEGTYIVRTCEETVMEYGYIDSLKDYWLNNVQCWYEPIEYNVNSTNKTQLKTIEELFYSKIQIYNIKKDFDDKYILYQNNKMIHIFFNKACWKYNVHNINEIIN